MSLEPKNSLCVSIVFPSICHEGLVPDAMILVFWMLSFKPTFSFSSFTLIKRLFGSLPPAVRVVSSAYLRLLVFLPAILIPACVSSRLTFHRGHSAYKLNKQVTSRSSTDTLKGHGEYGHHGNRGDVVNDP